MRTGAKVHVGFSLRHEAHKSRGVRGRHGAIKHSGPDGLRDVCRPDRSRALEVGNRARDAKHFAVGAGRESESRNGGCQEPRAALAERGCSLQISCGERAVGGRAGGPGSKSFVLNGACLFDAGPYGQRALSAGTRLECGHADGWKYDVHIDPIEQWPAQSRAVRTNAVGAAATTAGAIALVPAGVRFQIVVTMIPSRTR